LKENIMSMVRSTCHNQPVGVLLGGSGINRIASQPAPEIGALLKPRTGLDGCRSMPVDAVIPHWVVDWLDQYHRRVAACVDEAAREDPEFVLDLIRKLERSGDIAPDALLRIERIARRWSKIARDNLKKGQHNVMRDGAAGSLH
jgi:hypothetical protein